MLQVIPSPGTLETDIAEIKRKVARVSPYVKWVHIDIADGQLVENLTLTDPALFRSIPTPPKREVHLMVEDAIEKVDGWVGAGFDRIIAQIEGIGDPEGFIDAVQLHSVEVGLSLDIGTPATLVEPYLDQLDVVQLMGIEMGLSGQSFMPGVLAKIARIRDLDDMLAIEVDGGIVPATAKQCFEAGATRVAATSYIYGSEDIEEAIRELTEFT